MSCYHPLKGFPVGLTENGKTDYKVRSFSVNHLEMHNGKWQDCYDDFLSDYRERAVLDYIEIPCGHCIGCRLQKSRDWANRMLLESKEHKENWFLTLTYDNEHLPPANETVIDYTTGEIGDSPIHPLVKRDLQLFLKRLRKQQAFDFDNKIRFYACGEYGSKTFRPHYHLIVFGLHLDDLIQNGQNELGQPYFISKTIGELWTYGFHSVAPMTWETCAYVARYVTKKQYGENADIYEQLAITPEFSTMSRKPGIARQFYDGNKEKIYDTDEIFISLGDKGSRKVKPPRYFDKLFDIDYPDDCAIIKENRKMIAENLAKVKDNLTSLSYLEQLEVEELYKKEQTKILKRKDL